MSGHGQEFVKKTARSTEVQPMQGAYSREQTVHLYPPAPFSPSREASEVHMFRLGDSLSTAVWY